MRLLFDSVSTFEQLVGLVEHLIQNLFQENILLIWLRRRLLLVYLNLLCSHWIFRGAIANVVVYVLVVKPLLILKDVAELAYLVIFLNWRGASYLGMA